MASSASLSLFPPRTTSVPRKSSLKRPHAPAESSTPGELKGVAFQVTAAAQSPPRVQPAVDRVKHVQRPELVSGGAISESTSEGVLRRRDGRRRSRPLSLAGNIVASEGHAFPPAVEDELSPLPENTSFGSRSPPKRIASPQLNRPNVPRNISTEAQPDTDINDQGRDVDGGDRLSPLPENTRFKTALTGPSEYPAPLTVRTRTPSPAPSNSTIGSHHQGYPLAPSSSTTTTGLARSNSVATSLPAYSPPASAPPPRSIFPTYDPSRPLTDQAYYPTARPQVPVLPSEKVSKLGSTVPRPDPQRFDSAVGLVEGYEHIPAATRSDLDAIWNASTGHFPVAGRKVQLQLQQPRSDSMSLAIGLSADETLYSVEKALPATSFKVNQPWTELSVERHSIHDEATVPVAQLVIPDAVASKIDKDKMALTIFPQIAAIQALEAASNSPQAAEIAAFDPTAKSPAAARLAQDVVAETRRRHSCELVRTRRKRDSLGSVTATYSLEHPSLGTFAITITKSTAGRHVRDPRAKISLHHPSATAAAIAADTLVLAFLDFARDACVLDTPGLLALDSHYIIDTAISALLAVAFIENGVLMTEMVTFDPPPKTPARMDNGKSSSTKLKKQRRKSSMFRKAREDLVGEQVELPALTQGALALLSVSLRGAIALLETGVKLTASAIVGVSHLAQKL